MLEIEAVEPNLEIKPTEAVNPDLAGRSTVAMHLAGSGVEFKIDTAVDHSIAVVSLTAKLELVLLMLAEKTERLEASMMRIGQLEAELAGRREEVCVTTVKAEE